MDHGSLCACIRQRAASLCGKNGASFNLAVFLLAQPWVSWGDSGAVVVFVAVPVLVPVVARAA